MREENNIYDKYEIPSGAIIMAGQGE